MILHKDISKLLMDNQPVAYIQRKGGHGRSHEPGLSASGSQCAKGCSIPEIWAGAQMTEPRDKTGTHKMFWDENSAQAWAGWKGVHSILQYCAGWFLKEYLLITGSLDLKSWRADSSKESTALVVGLPDFVPVRNMIRRIELNPFLYSKSLGTN